MGNVVEVDLEKKSQRAQPILTSQVGTGGNCLSAIGAKIQAPADSVSCKGQKSHTLMKNMSFLRLAKTLGVGPKGECKVSTCTYTFF